MNIPDTISIIFLATVQAYGDLPRILDGATGNIFKVDPARKSLEK